jgi:hypothetical protein
MPTLYNANIPLNLFPLYLVQIGGLISAVLLAFLFWWHFFLQREDGTDALISDKPNHPLLFAVFISGLVAFLLKPVFDILVLKAECLSGLVIILTTASSSYLTVIYFIVSIVFVLSYLLFRDKKEANILPYAALLMTIVYVTILFISSFLNRINYGDMLSFTLSIKSINALFLFITSAIYLAVLAFSLYALIGEFLMLVREEFSDSKLYRRLMLMLYSHKVKLTDEQKKSLMDYMETMLEQGHEDYYIIEHIHKHTHWPIREISRALKELEDDDDAKHRYHQINHYHENLEYIDALSKKISVQYYTENMDILDIINFWLSKGAHEDDIAAAVMHLKYKKDDKELFKLMREVIEYRAD